MVKVLIGGGGILLIYSDFERPIPVNNAVAAFISFYLCWATVGCGKMVREEESRERNR